jgi:hypothetical protein
MQQNNLEMKHLVGENEIPRMKTGLDLPRDSQISL